MIQILSNTEEEFALVEDRLTEQFVARGLQGDAEADFFEVKNARGEILKDYWKLSPDDFPITAIFTFTHWGFVTTMVGRIAIPGEALQGQSPAVV